MNVDSALLKSRKSFEGGSLKHLVTAMGWKSRVHRQIPCMTKKKKILFLLWSVQPGIVPDSTSYSTDAKRFFPLRQSGCGVKINICPIHCSFDPWRCGYQRCLEASVVIHQDTASYPERLESKEENVCRYWWKSVEVFKKGDWWVEPHEGTVLTSHPIMFLGSARDAQPQDGILQFRYSKHSLTRSSALVC
jgi:hypothetical protein